MNRIHLIIPRKHDDNATLCIRGKIALLIENGLGARIDNELKTIDDI